jgi:signal transduction histidine kinase
METSLGHGVPLALLTLGIGYWLARQSVKPIAEVNRQLKSIRAANLAQRIQLPEVDREFRDLVHHINELLARLERSFTDMSDYAAQVAHELRTPLAILCLKVEQAGGSIAPELAEELQAELHQLSHVVDQSLLIAKAEQGRLRISPRPFELAAMVTDVAGDFSLLAQEESRALRLLVKSPAPVLADPQHIRQIIHNLLANALKHGQGEIRLRLRQRDRTFRLAFTNRLRSRAAEPRPTLGLGLRVVDSLLALQPDWHCRRRTSATCYTVCLTFPAAASAANTSQRSDSHSAIDPGI